MVRRLDEHRDGRARLRYVGGASLPGILAAAVLLLSSGCSSRNFSIGTKGDASADRVRPSTSDANKGADTTSPVTTDAGPDPFAGVLAGKVLAKLDFARAVSSTVMAGDNAIALFADVGLAFVDLTDPTLPVQGPALPTDGRVIALDYDEELGLAYAVDATGKLYVFSARSSEGFAKLYEAAVPALANKVIGMARSGSTMHLLTGDSVLPVIFALTGDVPTGASLGTTMTLGSTATHIAAGGGFLYLASKTAVQAWSVPTVGAATMLGQYAIAGEPRALMAKGSKVLVGVAAEGLSTVDFGNPAAPARLALDRSLADLTAARLFGRTLAVGLQRNLTATIDLSDFAAPRVLTVDQGAIPQFMAVLNGVLLRGTATSAQIVNIPPAVSISIPAVTAGSFPLHGSIPVTFSKPIDAASAARVLLSCAGTPVGGQAVVALERTALSFIPQLALPPGVTCTLDLSPIKDAAGLGVVGNSSLAVTTAPAAAKTITNNGSKYPHVADGVFTDANEWSDVTPAKGMYTYFYGDYQDGKLNILNDWFFNPDKIDSDCYNEFYVWTGGGSEEWTIRAYADRKVTVLKNGVVVDPTTSGVAGGAGYASSPNVKEPHTIYELQIAAKAGTWGVRLHDPGPTYSCKRLSAEPSHIQGSLGVVGAGSGATIDSTQKPLVPTVPTLLSPSNEAGVATVTPTLTWSSGTRETPSMLKYQVQISKVATFTSMVWNTGTMSSSYTVPTGVLGVDKTYYWRIVASNSVGQAISTVSSFFTGKRALPDAGADVAGKDAREPGYDAPVDWTGERRALTVDFAVSNTGDPGQGVVTTQPAGIACTNGAGTCSWFFGVGQQVTLTAKPAQGWHFVAWGGSCAGLKSSDTLTIEGGVEPLSCSVRFDLDGYDGGTAGTGGSTAGTSGRDAAGGSSGGTSGTDAAAGTGGTDAGARDAFVETGSVDAPLDTPIVDASIVDAPADAAIGDAGDAGGDAGSGVVMFTGAPSAIADDTNYLYIGQSGGNGIHRILMKGTSAATSGDILIVPGVSVPANGLAVGTQYVYWISGDTIMQASKVGGADAGAPTEFVTGETGLMLLGSNFLEGSSSNPTHLIWASGSLSNATIKAKPMTGEAAVTIASGVTLTASSRIRADSGNIYWVGATGGGAQAVYRKELGAGDPIQVGTDTGVTGLARFGTSYVAYMQCSASSCTLRRTTVAGTSVLPREGFPTTVNAVAGISTGAYPFGGTEIYYVDNDLANPRQVASDELAGDVVASNQGIFWFNVAGEVRKIEPAN